MQFDRNGLRVSSEDSRLFRSQDPPQFDYQFLPVPVIRDQGNRNTNTTARSPFKMH